MKIKWLGHSCFLFEASRPRLRILIDPYRAGAYDGAIGYRPVTEQADIVLVTHDHPDHAGVQSLPGRPLVVRGEAVAGGVAFETVELAHDDQQGRLRGGVRAFCFELDGLRIAHLGDVGHPLSERQQERLEGTQILLIPVGGRYTIDGATAWEICRQLRPNLVVPMHFKTAKVAMDLAPVDAFLAGQSRVRRVPQTTLELGPKELPEPITTVVLTPEN